MTVALKANCQIRTKAMYKDEDKRKETDRIRQKRRRDKIKAKGVTDAGRDEQGVTAKIYDVPVWVKPDACLLSSKPERTAQGNIRVSKPGDDDYVPQCETTKKRFIDGNLSIGENTTFGDLKRDDGNKDKT